MLQNALKFTETLNHYAAQLTDKQTELDQSVSVVVGEINSMLF
jgi:flagellar hook-associated protein FlgK